MDAAPLTADQLHSLKRMLLKKGAEINAKLTDLLAGQKVSMADIIQGRRGQSPIERLRGFMAIIDKSLIALRDNSYGRCERCHANLPFAHLEQVPWIDTCQDCAKIDAATES